jgi:sec-independent protein translocase protein TatB
MFNLDPAKLLIIAVVAVILLGPDRLPTFARQIGAAWRSFTDYRHRMEQEVRRSMPDLPSTAEITHLARSPSALLDRLSKLPSAAADEAPAVDPAARMTERTPEPLHMPERPVRAPGELSQSTADPGMN